MTTNVRLVYSGTKARLQAVLGVDYSPLTHVANIESNKFKGMSKRFGVIPQGQNEFLGETKANTSTQQMKIILTDAYVTTVLDENDIIEKMLTINDKMESIFRDLVLTKCGAPSVVIWVGNFSIQTSVLYETEKIMITEAAFDVRSRVTL
jgi:hypothetical protein